MNLKKGFQNLATVLASGIVILVLSGLALGILHLVVQIAFTLAVIWLIYRGAIFVIDGFKDTPKSENE